MFFRKKISHYYGDTVRKLFFMAALIMIITLPFFFEKVGQPLFVSMFAIFITGVAAGLTSPRHFLVAAVNVVISLTGLFMFEKYSVDWYIRYQNADSFFWTNQVLAVIFLLALYFSLKTIRWVDKIEFTERKSSDVSYWDGPPSNGDG